MGSEGNALVLSTMRALWGAVFPQLRAVYVSCSDSTWKVRFYVDGDISADDRESLTVAAAEIAADLPAGVAFEQEQITRLDTPHPIHADGWQAVYLRKEPVKL